jgi:protein-disulfide isomerase
VLLVATIPASILHSQPLSTEQTIQSLRRDMDELIKGQIELQKQLQDLKTFLQGSQACAQAPKQNIALDISGAPTQGQPTAPVTVIEFSDFQCPFSARYTNETFPRVKQQYIDTGKVRYVFHDFPLKNMHPLADRLAEAAQCASEQKKFWELRQTLFSNQAAVISEEAITEQAKSAKIDVVAFQRCLRDIRSANKVAQEAAEASANGVTGTPTFFLGRTEPTGSKVNILKIIVGHQPFENFKEAIESILAERQINGK